MKAKLSIIVSVLFVFSAFFCVISAQSWFEVQAFNEIISVASVFLAFIFGIAGFVFLMCAAVFQPQDFYGHHDKRALQDL